MKYAHLATRLYNSALLLTPSKAEVIEQVFRAHEEGRGALLAPAPAPKHEAKGASFQRTEGGYYRSSQGIAFIPVLGTLVQRGDSVDAMSGLTGYNRINAMLQAAIEDPYTSAILLEIDSPGGEANGAFDLREKIAAADAIKPTWVAVNEQAFSAAYLLASGAGRVAVPESGMVGSIGVVMMHVDQSAKDAKAGITYTPIYAGSHKVDFSSHAPLSDAARATAQEEVDRVYDLFVSAVATGRNVPADAVRSTEAALLNPRTALEAGLIDAVEGFDQTVRALDAEVTHIRMYGQRATARASIGDTTMTTQAPTPTAAAAAPAPAPAAAAPAVDTAALARAGAEAERARVAGILGHAEATGRRSLAEHLAFKTGSSIEDAAALLAAAPKEAAAAPANLLASTMQNVPNPNIGADAAGSQDNGEQKRIASAGEVYAFRKKCVEEARRQ